MEDEGFGAVWNVGFCNWCGLLVIVAGCIWLGVNTEEKTQ